ncbi:hypothetical protein DMUE_1025 [Dictyocoela muelleri]|nr:hypothetical protein DMUE_1025 [Dictyocoela muelleri]
MRLSRKKIIDEENEDDNAVSILTIDEIREIKFSRKTFKQMFKGSKLSCLQHMVSLRLIENSKICSCENAMSLISKVSVDGYIWVCRTATHRKEISVRKNSFFENLKKPFEDVLLFMFLWIKEDSQPTISSFIDLNKNTVSAWCLLCRIICQQVLIEESNF